MLDPRIEPSTPFVETELCRIEQILGRKLPEKYRDFALEYGGAFIGGLIDGDAKLPILTFFGPSKVLSSLETHPDLKSDGVLPIADCELNNLYVMDRENSIHPERRD